jgi:hypothetical protein
VIADAPTAPLDPRTLNAGRESRVTTHRALANICRAGQTGFEPNSTGIVRTMFVLYSLLIVGGIVFFVTIGLTQQ